MDWASYIEKTKSRYINYYTASAKRYTRNYAKLIESLPNMLNAVNEAWNCGNYRSVLEITEWLWSRGGQFLDRQRYMPESIELLNQAIKAAQLLGKRREEGHLLGHLGRAWMKSEKPREATKCFRQALEIAQEINDNQGVASNLG